MISDSESRSGWPTGLRQCLMAKKTPPPFLFLRSFLKIEYVSVSKISLLKWLSLSQDSVPAMMSGLVWSERCFSSSFLSTTERQFTLIIVRRLGACLILTLEV